MFTNLGKSYDPISGKWYKLPSNKERLTVQEALMIVGALTIFIGGLILAGGFAQ